MNVIVSGLTGSGKTTCSRAISDSCGLKYVSGSDLRRRHFALKGTEAGRAYWLRGPTALAADAERLVSGESEFEFDKRMISLHEHEDRLVFDAWFLAWLVRKPSLRIWLEVPFERRLQHVLDDLQPAEPETEMAEAVEAKDSRSREYALNQYGFDIGSDRHPFDVVLAPPARWTAGDLAGVMQALAHSVAGEGKHIHMVLPDAEEVSAALQKCPFHLRQVVLDGRS